MKKVVLAICCALVLSGQAVASSLTVYSAGPNHLIRALAQDFYQETGVRVEVFQGTTGQVLSRLEAERNNPLADVVISASWDSAEDLKQQGILAPLQLTNSEQVPDFLKDSHYIAQGVSALSLVVNTGSGLPLPNDWFDVAEPHYQDQVTMPDPGQSGSAFELLTGLLSAQGEEATWQFFAEMKDRGMIVPGPNARALNPVLQGARGLVFGAVDYIAFNHQARGESIEIIFPASGTVIAPRPMMVTASSQNQQVAMDFIDFVLSDQGQKQVADVYLMPARSDVQGQRPGLDALEIITPDSALTEQREELIHRFRRVME